MAKYALTNQTLTGFTKLSGRNALKLQHFDDKNSGLRRIRIKWLDLVNAVSETNFANTGTATIFAVGDTLAVLPVHKGELAEYVALYVLKGDATTGTIVVGDSGTAAGWSGTATAATQTTGSFIDPLKSCTTGGFNIGAASTNLGAFGKFYTADDAVCLTFGTAIPVVATANGIIEVVLKYTNLLPNLKAGATSL